MRGENIKARSALSQCATPFRHRRTTHQIELHMAAISLPTCNKRLLRLHENQSFLFIPTSIKRMLHVCFSKCHLKKTWDHFCFVFSRYEKSPLYSVMTTAFALQRTKYSRHSLIRHSSVDIYSVILHRSSCSRSEVFGWIRALCWPSRRDPNLECNVISDTLFLKQ